MKLRRRRVPVKYHVIDGEEFTEQRRTANRRFPRTGIKMSVAEMYAHIRALARKHHIKVNVACWRPSDASASVRTRVIDIAPIKSANGYATALHEIGHVVLRHRYTSVSRIQIGQEHAAWDWARANSRMWNWVMEVTCAAGLASYHYDKVEVGFEYYVVIPLRADLYAVIRDRCVIFFYQKWLDHHDSLPKRAPTVDEQAVQRAVTRKLSREPITTWGCRSA
jgi:hypothetical protein